ncbi:MAG: omptin family outer membrane protease [Candidatus Omnitrophota bacterium]
MRNTVYAQSSSQPPEKEVFLPEKEILKAAPPEPEPEKEVAAEPLPRKSTKLKLNISDDWWLGLGLNLGYIKGNTTYDFNHHTSELEFPLNNPMIGGEVILGYKDFSFISELWGTLSSSCASDMKDKDWNGAGGLISHTESSADLDAIICDGGFRYDFFQTFLPFSAEWLTVKQSDVIKFGFLGGYRYEKFDFNCYGVKYPDLGDYEIYAGEKSITYKVAYQLPYIGMAIDLAQEKSGLGISFKYAISPSGRDVDNHLLRGLTFPAKYNQNGQAYIGGVNGFYRFNP